MKKPTFLKMSAQEHKNRLKTIFTNGLGANGRSCRKSHKRQLPLAELAFLAEMHQISFVAHF